MSFKNLGLVSLDVQTLFLYASRHLTTVALCYLQVHLLPLVRCSQPIVEYQVGEQLFNRLGLNNNVSYRSESCVSLVAKFLTIRGHVALRPEEVCES